MHLDLALHKWKLPLGFSHCCLSLHCPGILHKSYTGAGQPNNSTQKKVKLLDTLIHIV
jgi:hypothetical protein